MKFTSCLLGFCLLTSLSFSSQVLAEVEAHGPFFASYSMGGAAQLGGDAAPNGSRFLGRSIGTPVGFAYGVKIGVLFAEIENFSQLGMALRFDRTVQNYDNYIGAGIGIQGTFNDLQLQILFRKIYNTSFYFAPTVGVASGSISEHIVDYTFATDAQGKTFTASGSLKNFILGFDAGYEFFTCPQFSVAPEMRFEHIFTSLGASNHLKLVLAGNYYF